MKDFSSNVFFSILGGSLIGGILAVAATYSTEPRDPAFYFSLSDYLLFSAAISLTTSVIFWFFYRFFKVSTKNLFIIGLAALGTQAATYFALPILPIDLGILGFAAALVVFSAIANFLLDKFGR